MTLTPQSHKYISTRSREQASMTTANGFAKPNFAVEEESKLAGTASKNIKEILEDLQNNQLQIYALWCEDGDVHRSFIQQPLRSNSLNMITLTQKGRTVST